MDACEQLLAQAEKLDDVTVRRIAALAETNVSAINYHFGSYEKLVVAVAERVYQRLNAERLRMLQTAVQRRSPRPPLLEDVIGALVGPSVRWSLDSKSSYAVFRHLTAMELRSKDRAIYRPIVEDIGHHWTFVHYLKQVTPWLSESEIGWRVNCALGIRSQVTRQRARTEVLTNHELDFTDPETVIDNMIMVIVPMFSRPNAAVEPIRQAQFQTAF
jgi:AcrR family transcriptional regulator